MLYGWMKSLIIYLIFAGAVINLSPSGNYKKYIRLFAGLIAILILMKPISYIFDFDESKLFVSMENVEGLSEPDYVDGNYDEIMDYYDLSLIEGIKMELINRGFIVEEIVVIADQDNKLISCSIFVNASAEIDPVFQEKQIKSYINEVYNLNIDNIYVVRR